MKKPENKKVWKLDIQKKKQQMNRKKKASLQFDMANDADPEKLWQFKVTGV